MTDLSQFNVEYDDIENESVIFDTESNKVLEKEDITPWDIIKTMAQTMGTPIRDPRENCVHCYGRGYVGFRAGTKEPVPCQCIFTDTQKEKDIPLKLNREQRRKLQKNFKKLNKKGIKLNKKEEEINE